MSPIDLIKFKPASSRCPLETFVACAHQMLDPATPEPVLCVIEPKLLEQLPAIRALGVFDLFEIRDPSLRAWLNDELAKLEESTRFFNASETREPIYSAGNN